MRKIGLLVGAMTIVVLGAFVAPSMASAQISPHGYACTQDVAQCDTGGGAGSGKVATPFALTATLQPNTTADLDAGAFGSISCDQSTGSGNITNAGPSPNGPVGYLGAVSFTDSTTGDCPTTFGTLGNPYARVSAVDTNGSGTGNEGFWDVVGNDGAGPSGAPVLVFENIKVNIGLAASPGGPIVIPCVYRADEVVGVVDNTNQTLTFTGQTIIRDASSSLQCPPSGDFSAAYDINPNSANVYLTSE